MPADEVAASQLLHMSKTSQVYSLDKVKYISQIQFHKK